MTASVHRLDTCHLCDRPVIDAVFCGRCLDYATAVVRRLPAAATAASVSEAPTAVRPSVAGCAGVAVGAAGTATRRGSRGSRVSAATTRKKNRTDTRPYPHAGPAPTTPAA